jgi:hypothetical protein
MQWKGSVNVGGIAVSKKRLRDVRIALPKGLYYDLLTAGQKLHGSPSLSRYILNAAMTYTTEYLKKKKEQIDEQAESNLRLRDSTESIPDDPDQRSDSGDGD